MLNISKKKEILSFLFLIILIFIVACSNNQKNYENVTVKENKTISINKSINNTIEIIQNNSTNLKNEAEYEITYAKNLAYEVDEIIEENIQGVSKTKEKRAISLLKNATLLIYEAQEELDRKNYEIALKKAKEARSLVNEAKRIY